MGVVIAGEFFRLISPIVSIVSPAVIPCVESGTSRRVDLCVKSLNPL
jgi:hypothetical protein